MNKSRLAERKLESPVIPPSITTDNTYDGVQTSLCMCKQTYFHFTKMRSYYNMALQPHFLRI